MSAGVPARYEVPAGMVAVVRCFAGLLHGTDVESKAALLGPHEGTIFQAVLPLSAEPWELLEGIPFLWNGRAAFYEGELIFGACLSGNVDLYCTGYLLSAEGAPADL